METFFVSDLHFYHKNIIKYSDRPWDHIHDMNDDIVDNWNAMVKKDDAIYILGDLAFCGTTKLNLILDRLNGRKYLIKGNHDPKQVRNNAHFEWVKDTYELKVNDKTIFLSHYSHKVWPNSHRGNWHLFGHSHGNLVDMSMKSFDVGVDALANRLSFLNETDNLKEYYRPMSFMEVAMEMSNHAQVKLDHH